MINIFEQPNLNPTIFLDRDGVINIDSDQYIKTKEEFVFIDKSIEAIVMLFKKGFDIIVITNQSAIGRKLISHQTLNLIFEKMKDDVNKSGAKIKDIFFCPHKPSDKCSCRKPKPGLINLAKKKYNIDLNKSFMIGDSAKDIECAFNAGCFKSILVQTENISKEKILLKQKNIAPDFICANLYEAACLIVANYKNLIA